MHAKKLIPVVALTAALAAAPALAGESGGQGASRDTTIGVLAGGLVGALVGGPPGMIAGAALGGYTGDRTGEARKVRPLTERVAVLESQRDVLAEEGENLRVELVSVRRSLDAERSAAAQARDAATLADGLAFDVPFRTGSSEPEAEQVRGLDALAMLMSAAPDLVLRLDGYADPRGGEDYNVGLSTARAESIRAHLVAAGVESHRIIVTGHGELTPTQANDPESWAMQRRVGVKLELAEDRLAARP